MFTLVLSIPINCEHPEYTVYFTGVVVGMNVYTVVHPHMKQSVILLIYKYVQIQTIFTFIYLAPVLLIQEEPIAKYCQHTYKTD